MPVVLVPTDHRIQTPGNLSWQSWLFGLRPKCFRLHGGGARLASSVSCLPPRPWPGLRLTLVQHTIVPHKGKSKGRPRETSAQGRKHGGGSNEQPDMGSDIDGGG